MPDEVSGLHPLTALTSGTHSVMAGLVPAIHVLFVEFA